MRSVAVAQFQLARSLWRYIAQSIGNRSNTGLELNVRDVRFGS